MGSRTVGLFLHVRRRSPARNGERMGDSTSAGFALACPAKPHKKSSMNFTSDNTYGAAPEILEALAEASVGAVPSYGDDPLTEKLRGAMTRLFEREVAV